MRRKLREREKHPVEPDQKYGSTKVSKFINHIMLDGKKDTARRIVYKAFDHIKTTTEQDPVEVFELALKNAGPVTEVRSRRIGGANYQVPREVPPQRRMLKAMTWIILAARAKSGKDMYTYLAQELIEASKGEGEAVKKKENTHKMAEANKAFAHFSW